jgi:putative Mn2+ efflux pump MntP
MDLITICGIGIGLSMDAFAVSISCGLTIKNLKKRNAFKIGAFFGGFQAVMPMIGWLAGLNLRKLISGLDHWVAFGLLTIVGARMIYEATRPKYCERKINPLKHKTLLLLSVATSIDALAVGLSFAFLNISIILPVIIIGLITFTISFAGVLGGKRIGRVFRRKVEIIGALILILIGVKILFQHIINNI